MKQWLVYVADAPQVQVNIVVVVPAYDALGLPADPELRPVRDEMKPGDRVWFYDAQNKPPGIISLCEVTGVFSEDRAHPAYPEMYNRSYQWPVRVLAGFDDNPISRQKLFELAREHSWESAPLDKNGNFKQGAVYCHELPLAIAEKLAQIPRVRKQRLRDPFSSLLSACLGVPA